MRRAAGIALAVLLAAAAAPPGAQALTKAQADRIALRILQPQRQGTAVQLHSSVRPLSARRRVDVFTGRAQTLTRRALGRPTWLYWLDLAPGAMFEHASRLLLLDDRTGRVRSLRTLSWYPLVDGRRPPFVREGRPPAATSASQPRYVITPQDLAQDCMVTIGDVGPPASPVPLPFGGSPPAPTFRRDLEAMEGWAARVGLRHRRAQASARGLREAVAQMIEREECTDVFIFLVGHGISPPGPSRQNGRTVVNRFGGSAGVVVRVRYTLGRQTALSAEVVRPRDLEQLVNQYNGRATFKIKINACYAGRFFFALEDKPNVKVLELSSAADETSYFAMSRTVTTRGPQGQLVRRQNTTTNPGGITEFTYRNLFGLETWSRSQLEVALTNRQLVNGIARAFDLGANEDFAATIGYTHPIRVFRR